MKDCSTSKKYCCWFGATEKKLAQFMSMQYLVRLKV